MQGLHPLDIAEDALDGDEPFAAQLTAAAVAHYQRGHWQEAQAAALISIAVSLGPVEQR